MHDFYSRRALILFLAPLLTAGCVLGQTPKKEPDVPYVPTTDEAVAAMLDLAGVQKNDIVYDLGCGDGRIVVTAARKFGARGVGIDINPVRIKEAQENAKRNGVEHLVRFVEKDLFEADIKEATVVSLFLLSHINLKLKPKLMRDLKPGTRIVSNTFDMGDWKPEKEFTVGLRDDEDSFLSRRLFLWTIPKQ
ncbi:MAG: methyltransferase domain-containing protein [Acidobacteria bacterium]|nr:methyltransferase domain-containing protein [Acidobacteriota bacterium]